MTALGPIDVVTLCMGGERIAIPAVLLREIMEPVHVTRVPTASRFAGSSMSRFRSSR